MRKLDKVPTDTTEDILNKISELDGHQMIPMPEAMRERVKQKLEKQRRLEQSDTT